jgi:hypothetical protein
MRVVSVLKRLQLDLHEACLLYLWDDARELPLDYLLTIADRERTEEDLAALHPTIGRQLCHYLASERDVRADADRRVYAIQHLGAFGRKDAERLLNSLLRKRRGPFKPKEPKIVREAAQTALTAIHKRWECRDV